MSNSKTPTSSPVDALKRRISVEQNALDDLQLNAVELQEQRKAALLADGDEQLESVEAAIVATLRRAERHKARRDALLVELEAAEDEQRHQEALADYQRAADKIAEAENWLMTRYAVLAAELAAGLARIQVADRLAERVNAERPAGCPLLRPPSHARHEPKAPDRQERRKRTYWASSSGHEIRGIQIDAEGKPSVFGARLVEVEEEVVVPGRTQWWPSPIYTEVRLPRLHRDDRDFWTP